MINSSSCSLSFFYILDGWGLHLYHLKTVLVLLYVLPATTYLVITTLMTSLDTPGTEFWIKPTSTKWTHKCTNTFLFWLLCFQLSNNFAAAWHLIQKLLLGSKGSGYRLNLPAPRPSKNGWTTNQDKGKRKRKQSAGSLAVIIVLTGWTCWGVAHPQNPHHSHLHEGRRSREGKRGVEE